MLKTNTKFFLILLSIAAPVLSFNYEPQLQNFFPHFRAEVVLSGIILIAGSTMAIFIRHMGVFIVALAMAIALPFLIRWFVNYWPYMSAHCFG